MPRAGEPDLTRDELLGALRRLRQRLHWIPDDLDVALQQRVTRAAIHGLARQIQRDALAAASAPRRRPVAPPSPSLPPPAWDARRAAAGDLDD